MDKNERPKPKAPVKRESQAVVKKPEPKQMKKPVTRKEHLMVNPFRDQLKELRESMKEGSK